jgi:hypothetical protein
MWMKSLEHVGAIGIVLHDDLDPKFILNHTTPSLRFIAVTGHTNHSPNDRRLFLLHDILKNEPDIRWLMLTDIKDIVFGRNPFQFAEEVKANQTLSDPQKSQFPIVFVANDNQAAFRKHLLECPGLYSYFNNNVVFSLVKSEVPAILAAIWFSDRVTMISLLLNVTESIDKMNPCFNCNTAAANFVIYSMANDHLFRLFSGTPFHVYHSQEVGNVVYHNSAPPNEVFSEWSSEKTIKEKKLLKEREKANEHRSNKKIHKGRRKGKSNLDLSLQENPPVHLLKMNRTLDLLSTNTSLNQLATHTPYERLSVNTPIDQIPTNIKKNELPMKSLNIFILIEIIILSLIVALYLYKRRFL